MMKYAFMQDSLVSPIVTSELESQYNFKVNVEGGGIKGGGSWGETDEIGYAAVKGKTSVHDIQATILNQLGFNHEKLTYQFQGRPFRLTDVSGKVISEIVA